MSEAIRLKLRMGKQNSSGREMKTQYHPEYISTSFRNIKESLFDSIDMPKQIKITKPSDLKFIPMKGTAFQKTIITQPNNNNKLSSTQRIAVNKLFNKDISKNSKDKTCETVHQKILLGKQRYTFVQQIGSGTFGTVYKARDKKSLDVVAIKKVYQDKKYKNRQLQILKIIDHPNILRMKDSFFTVQGEKQYLNVVMDHFSCNLYDFITKNKKNTIPKLLVKLLSYQLIRGLLYLETEGIAHRDIKPQNILVDQSNWNLVICDFGSAKKLKKGQSNIAYICSRSYRAPELIFGCTDYTTQIDMWSVGCVLAQLISTEPIFRARSSSQHLVEIIKILGTPSQHDILQMNPECDIKKMKFPSVTPKGLDKVLSNSHYGEQFMDLLSNILKYSPKQRLTPMQALKHPFFSELRQQSVFRKLKKQFKNLDLFNFKQTNQKTIKNINQLIPFWHH